MNLGKRKPETRMQADDTDQAEDGSAGAASQGEAGPAPQPTEPNN